MLEALKKRDSEVSFSIRDVAKKDRIAIMSIIEGTENLTQREKDCAREVLDDYLKDPGGGYHFLAAVNFDDVPFGYVSYGMDGVADGVFDIYWLLVSPEKRGKGTGRALLSGAEDAVRKVGARLMAAETSSLQSYETARRLYSRCGYEAAARLKDFFKPGDDKIIYIKHL